ncbi:hypothetical protein ACSBR1_039873 [Camellia fascicularis]
MHDSRIFKEIIENKYAPFLHPQEGAHIIEERGGKDFWSVEIVLKFLNDMPDYDFATVQVPLVGALMALHNFIRRHEVAANAHNEHVSCSSVLDDMLATEGGQNMDDSLMVGDTDVNMARVRVRIRDHLFHI